MKDFPAAVDDAVRALKIGFSPEEKKRLGRELAAFEQWLEPLLTVDTAETEPLLFSHEAVNVFGEDKPAAGDTEKLQRTAANFDAGFYRVPPVIE